MITVKLVGGAKKSFSSDILKIDKSDISIQKLLELLLEQKPVDLPSLDVENILIAINGADSSAMDGKSTVIKNNDVVSIIPVIHGGSSKKLLMEVSKKHIQIIEIKGQKTIDVKFIDTLRNKYPKIQLQAISSNYILNKNHFRKIISLSIEAKKNNILLSNKLEIDILMRFALTKQISDAISTVGIKPKVNFILISMGNKKTLDLLYDELNPLTVDLFQSKNSSFLKKHFKISQKQLDVVNTKTPLEDILVEKAAILL